MRLVNTWINTAYPGKVDTAFVKRGCASRSYQSALKKLGSNKEDLVDIVCWDFQGAFSTREGGFWKRRESWTAGFLATGLCGCCFVGYKTDQINLWEYRGINPTLENPHIFHVRKVFWKSIVTFSPILMVFLYLPLLNADGNGIIFSNPECSCDGAVAHMEISRKYGHWCFQMAYLLCLIDEP